MKLAAAGLRQQPFQSGDMPLVLVPYAAQRAALQFLRSTLSDGRGLGLFHGPPQSGKSCAIRQFLASFSGEVGVAVIDGRESAMLQKALNQFGFDHGLESPTERFNMLKVFALQQTTHDHAPLLVIENAHSMNAVAMEMLCELAELRVQSKFALRIVLVGDRPLLPVVRAPAMESVSSRVTGEFLLRPMTRKETAYYVYRKLVGGGCANPRMVFPAAVCDRLHGLSGGWPGKVDQLAMQTLSKARRCPVRIEDVPRRPMTAEMPAGVTVLGQPSATRVPVAAAEGCPHLILTCGGKTLKRVVLDGARLMVGRSDHNDLKVVGEWISRQHAIFIRHGGATVLLDLKSRNGTYVNGDRIGHKVVINNDVIDIGDHRIKFIDPSAKHRMSLRGAGFDETTIKRSIKTMREVIARRLGGGRTG